MDLRQNVDRAIAAWEINVDHTAETETSALVFGHRQAQPVVIKILKRASDEWRSGDVLTAFDGLAQAEGALLLERLSPAYSLASLGDRMSDDEKTGILAGVIRQMVRPAPIDAMPTVTEWGTTFDRHAVADDAPIPRALVDDARAIYLSLCESQSSVRLLHGDLHHDNVLFDSMRGWIAVDPKGVIGELEYEVGASLRNPYEAPHVFADAERFRRRVDIFARDLHVDAGRVTAWAFAQAVLATIWAVEDRLSIEPDHGWIRLAHTLRPLLNDLIHVRAT